MKKFLLILFQVLWLVLFLSNAQVYAAPARGEEEILKQPTGEIFRATPAGDEWFNWVKTAEGEIVIKDAQDNYWYYAELDEQDIKKGQARYKLDKKPTGIVNEQQFKVFRQNKDKNSKQYLPELTPISSTQTQNNINTHKVLVLLVSFSDVSIQNLDSNWSSQFFAASGNTIRNYFNQVSNGKFYFVPAEETAGIINDGVVKVFLNYPHPNTASSTGSINQKIVSDALQAADAKINYLSFDTDGNGAISNDELHIVTVIAGYEASYSAAYNPSVWGHRWNLDYYPTVLDGVKLGDSAYGGGYTQQGEIHRSSTSNAHRATIGIFAHELGHDLGLPDLYDTDYSSKGVGIHSLMGEGSWGYYEAYPGTQPTHFDPWSKIELGFVNPIVMNNVGMFTLNAAVSGNYNILKIPTANINEYFLIENRQFTGFDIGLKYYFLSYASGGIAIWHIDDNVIDAQRAFNTVNNNENHKGVDLEEANQIQLSYSQLDRGIEAGAYNHYYTNSQPAHRFADNTVPNSKLYSNTASNVVVRVISSPGSFMGVITDEMAPTGCITINNGDMYTNSKLVKLTLLGVDNSGSIYQMQFSNDAVTWSDWEPYAANKAWQLLGGYAEKTVFVRFKDTSGNISDIYRDDIKISTAGDTLSERQYLPTPKTLYSTADAGLLTKFTADGKSNYPYEIYLPNEERPEYYRIHSNYSKNTDACASCHKTHAAVGSSLLQWYSTYETCIACHDGTVTTTYNVVEGYIGVNSSNPTFGGHFGLGNEDSLSSHSIKGAVTIGAAPGGSADIESWANTFGCESCHSPHGQAGNARVLHPDPNGWASKNLRFQDNTDIIDKNIISNVVYLINNEERLTIIKGYPYNIELKDSNGKNITKNFRISNVGDEVYGSYTAITPKAGHHVDELYCVSGTASVTVRLSITGYLQSNEKVKHISGLNTFCAACHVDYIYNIQGQYSSAHRHSVGVAWNYGNNADENYIGSERLMKTMGDSEPYISCLTCHFAHGTSKLMWKKWIAQYDKLFDDNWDTDIALEEFIGSSALKRLPNMSTCEACHQKAAANQGYAANTGHVKKEFANTKNGIFTNVSAGYVGVTAGRCQLCHPTQYQEWSKSKHKRIIAAGENYTQKCIGCHATGYEPGNGWREVGVSCEACHGPAGNHVKYPSDKNIVTPANLSAKYQNDLCGQCHSLGLSASNTPFPIGYIPGEGKSLADKFNITRSDESNFWPDGSAKSKYMEYNDFTSNNNKHFTNGITCITCHSAHGENNAGKLLKAPGYLICANCHDVGFDSMENLVNSYMPFTAKSLPDGTYDLRSHRMQRDFAYPVVIDN